MSDTRNEGTVILWLSVNEQLPSVQVHLGNKAACCRRSRESGYGDSRHSHGAGCGQPPADCSLQGAYKPAACSPVRPQWHTTGHSIPAWPQCPHLPHLSPAIAFTQACCTAPLSFCHSPVPSVTRCDSSHHRGYQLQSERRLACCQLSKGHDPPI